MKIWTLRLSALVCAICGSALVTPAAQVTLILRTGTDSWQAIEAEKIAINSKSKVRIGASGSLEIQPGEYKKLPPEEILREGVLRRHPAGYLVRNNGGNWTPIAPDGAVNPKSTVSYATLWSSAEMLVQKDRSAKSAVPVDIAQVFAILPGVDSNGAIVSFLCDPANFRGAGENSDTASFDERMSLLVSAAGFVTGPSVEKLQQLILSEMTTANDHLAAGIAHYGDLQHGLQYVEVSQKAWPEDPRQQKARTALIEKKKWLNQRMAILKALRAGELWDAFLDKYSDFDRYDSSFDDLRTMRERALSESTKQHYSEGKRLYEAKQYGPATIELKLAQLRDPGNKDIAAQIELASIQDESTSVKPGPWDIHDPRQKQITRHLSAAKNYIENKKWEAAESEIRQSEALDKKSYRVLFTRALLLEAQGKLLEAESTLNQYAKLVSAEEDVSKGEDLRGTISSELNLRRDRLRESIEKAEGDGNYPLAKESAQAGVELDSTNLFFLLHAGRNNAIMRNRVLAKQQLVEYVRVSQSSAGDKKELAKVYDYLEALKIAIPEPEGNPNWYSGYRSAPGLFYCPVSLMPNARISDIRASKKQMAAFQWNNNGQLATITTSNLEAGEPGVTVYFDYFKDRDMVRRVATEAFGKEDSPAPHLTENGAMGEKGAYVALLNYPGGDLFMAERLTGRRVATVVAGNAYFNPFVWKGVYRFLAEYDDQGRMKSATRLGDTSGGPHILDFRWQGMRLEEIAERGGQGYRRAMTYNGDRLVSEMISFRGKNTKIEYKYRGDHLAEAESGDDPSIDGRSRHVTFR